MSNPIKPIKVAILENDQRTVDGYLRQFASSPQIRVVGAVGYGAALLALLAEQSVDVAILDFRVPTAQDDTAPFSIVPAMRQIHQTHPDLALVVITMYLERGLIELVMEAGAKGYILKDDRAAFQGLANVVQSVAAGRVYLSEQVKRVLRKGRADETPG